MFAAFEGHHGRFVRHQLTPDTALALERAVAGSPPVADTSAGFS
jgi:hypothetical protein